MIRFVIVAVVAIVTCLLLRKLFRSLQERRIDWTGITAMIGFVVLAFYLRHVTGMG
ncbi:hypothetical protein [Mesorhizobium sp. ANAO-SY3R2]|uniref:hypothetical protein n=1 Tax=Mesorhizobium sp. ANAO-SY3R2 TaxID=3166644 RepID=UPI003671C31F